jgi:chromate reductase
LRALNANVLKEATMLIPFIRSKMDGDGNIIDEEVAEKLKDVFKALVKNI